MSDNEVRSAEEKMAAAIRGVESPWRRRLAVLWVAFTLGIPGVVWFRSESVNRSLDRVTTVLQDRSPVIAHLQCYENRLSDWLDAITAEAQFSDSLGDGPVSPADQQKLQALESDSEQAQRVLGATNRPERGTPCPSYPSSD